MGGAENKESKESGPRTPGSGQRTRKPADIPTLNHPRGEAGFEPGRAFSRGEGKDSGFSVSRALRGCQ
jgi:hypothetical protein